MKINEDKNAALRWGIVPRWLSTRWCTISVVLLATAHFALLLQYFSPGIFSPDANGYFKQARLLAETGSTSFSLEKPLQYVNTHWVSSDHRTYYSQYPPGLAWLSAPGYLLGKTTGALLVNPLLASLSLLGVFWLARRWGLSQGWALIPAVLLAMNPAFNEHALWEGSHIAVLFCLVFGALALTKWGETNSPSWGMVAGLLWGMIPAIRYPEALYGLAVAVFALLHFKRDKRYAVGVVALFIGAAVPLSALAIRNHLAFDACWKTGYALTGEQTAFSWADLSRNHLNYLQALRDEGLGWLAGVGVAGLGLMVFRRELRRYGILSLLTIVPIVLLYMSYYWSMGVLRFLLPIVPLLMIAGVFLLAQLAETARGAAMAATGTLLLLLAIEQVPQSRQRLVGCREQGREIVEVTRLLAKTAPPGAIVIAPERIAAHLDVVGTWRLVDENALRGERGFGGGGEGEVGPRVAQRGRILELAQIYGGGLSVAAWQDIVQWSGRKQQIFWIGEKATLTTRLGTRQDVVLIAEAEVQSAPRSGLGGGRRGSMRGPAFPGMQGRGGMGAFPGMQGLVRPGLGESASRTTTWSLFQWLGEP
jgi:hypothetical protein